MTKTAMLNLDELETPTKVLRLNGREHTMRDMTVQEFIDASAEAKRARERAAEQTVDEQVAEVVDQIAKAFPTLGEDELAALPLPKLTALLEFTIKPPEAIAAEVEAQAKQGNG